MKKKILLFLSAFIVTGCSELSHSEEHITTSELRGQWDIFTESCGIFINTNIRENQVLLMVVMIRILDLDYTGMNIYQQSLYAQIKVETISL